MRNESVPIPNEDAVVETILQGTDEDILRLLQEHPSCTDFARDVQSVKDGLKSIEEQQPPPLLLKSIITSRNNHLFSWLQDLPLEWYRNPYILSFGFVMATVFFYLFIVFFLKF
jgi:hypothetical protein